MAYDIVYVKNTILEYLEDILPVALLSVPPM